jgi:hypothetical protein
MADKLADRVLLLGQVTEKKEKALTLQNPKSRFCPRKQK